MNFDCHLVLDATWFGRQHCFLIYWDADLKHTQWWRYATSENSDEIIQDLINLKKANVICSSITSDGGGGIRKAVEMVYPNIPHQRCITHVQRLGLVPGCKSSRHIRIVLYEGEFDLTDTKG